jgi:hypothetical protein
MKINIYLVNERMDSRVKMVNPEWKMMTQKLALC